MKLSDLITQGDNNNLSDSQLEANRGLRSLIDEMGDLEIDSKDQMKWLEKAHKRHMEHIAYDTIQPD
jgi:hypothetical protein